MKEGRGFLGVMPRLQCGQISADHCDYSGPDLRDDAFVTGMNALTKQVTSSAVWLGEDTFSPT